MKLVITLVGLSVLVMFVMIFQTVRQELDLRYLKSHMVENSAEVTRKEEAIVDVKNKVLELQKSLDKVNEKIEALKKKKTGIDNSADALAKTMKACTTEKENADKIKTATGEQITKLKEDHEEAKSKAQLDIQSLKQQILDREKAICAFADTTKEEARKLCGLAEARK